METFQFICNLIILVGGATAVITRFLEPHFRFFKTRQAKHLEEAIKEILPKYLEEFRKEESEKQEENQKILEEIRAINLKQNKDIENIIEGLRDDLRHKIMDIYQKYKNEKKIPISEKEKLDETMVDYKKLNGNHYIDKYYARMQTWEVIQDYEEEEI